MSVAIVPTGLPGAGVAGTAGVTETVNARDVLHGETPAEFCALMLHS